MKTTKRPSRPFTPKSEDPSKSSETPVWLLKTKRKVLAGAIPPKTLEPIEQSSAVTEDLLPANSFVAPVPPKPSCDSFVRKKAGIHFKISNNQGSSEISENTSENVKHWEWTESELHDVRLREILELFFKQSSSVSSPDWLLEWKTHGIALFSRLIDKMRSFQDFEDINSTNNNEDVRQGYLLPDGVTASPAWLLINALGIQYNLSISDLASINNNLATQWISLLGQILDFNPMPEKMVSWDLLLVTSKILALYLQNFDSWSFGLEGCISWIEKIIFSCCQDNEREDSSPSHLNCYHVSVLHGLLKIFNEVVRSKPEAFYSAPFMEKTISWIISVTEYVKTFGFKFTITFNDFLNVTAKLYDSLGFMTESVDQIDVSLLAFIWNYDSTYDFLMSSHDFAKDDSSNSAVIQSVTKITRVFAHLCQSEELRSDIQKSINARERDEKLVKDSIQFLLLFSEDIDDSINHDLFATILCFIANLTCPLDPTSTLDSPKEFALIADNPELLDFVSRHLIKHGLKDIEITRELFRILANISYFNSFNQEHLPLFEEIFETWINEKLMSILASQILANKNPKASMETLYYCLGFLVNVSQISDFATVMVRSINLNAIFSLILNKFVDKTELEGVVNTLLQLLSNLLATNVVPNDFWQNCLDWLYRLQDNLPCDPMLLSALLSSNP